MHTATPEEIERVRTEVGMYSPTPEEIKHTRTSAGFDQTQMAKMAGYNHRTRWSEAERGQHKMDEARWELVRIKLGLHPLYGPLTRFED